MTKGSPESSKKGFFERGLKWGEQFNRRLGMVALGVAGGAAVLGAPVIATAAAGYAGFNFVEAEVEKRIGNSIGKRH